MAGLLNKVALRGHRGAIFWRGAYAEAAQVAQWTASRPETGKPWTLRAVLVRPPDSYRIKQSSLFFTAPRMQKPFGWYWFPVLSVSVQGLHVTAQLGPLEGR